MRKLRFEDGEIYHVYNRGVEKRDVYQDDGDYLRFVHHLYELNDVRQARNLTYHFSKNDSESTFKEKRNQLVRILAFALMPNHFHLLIQQIEEGGISKFMQKLGTGFTMFFNEKNTRTGVLFQGKFKAVHVVSDEQLRHVLHYIHLNPMALCAEETESHEKLAFLKEYKWSSLPDYIGARSFPSVTYRSSMIEMFGNKRRYEESFVQAMSNKSMQDNIDPSILLDFQ